MQQQQQQQQQQPVQDVVLFESSIDKEQYGDQVVEVKFPDPVQIRVIHAAHAAQGIPPGHTPGIRAWARDVFSQSAARFVIVLGTQKQAEAVGVQLSSFQPTEVLSTDHLVLHGKFKCLKLALHGSVVKQAAQLVQAQAEQHLGPLPPAVPLLPPPSAALKQQQQQQQLQSPPQLQLHPAPLLPLSSLPAAFVQVLSVAVEYWRRVRLSHSRIESNPPNGCLEGLAQLADAVLAALRGKPGALQAQLTAAAAGAEAASSGWSAIQDDALDMAASWCRMLASCRTHTPFDMEVGVAGLAAAILLATCSSTAAQFLALIDERQELAGAAAVRGVVCIPNAPPVISRYALGLLELLLGSSPAVTCAALFGPFTPVLEGHKQQQQQQRNADGDMERLRSPVQQQLLAGGVDGGRRGRGRHSEDGATRSVRRSGSGVGGGSGAGQQLAAGSGRRSQGRESSPGSSRRRGSGQLQDSDAAAAGTPGDAEYDGGVGEDEDDEGGLYDELDSLEQLGGAEEEEEQQQEEDGAAYGFAAAADDDDEGEERLSLSGHEDMEYEQDGDEEADYAKQQDGEGTEHNQADNTAAAAAAAGEASEGHGHNADSHRVQVKGGEHGPPSAAQDHAAANVDHAKNEHRRGSSSDRHADGSRGRSRHNDTGDGGDGRGGGAPGGAGGESAYRTPVARHGSGTRGTTAGGMDRDTDRDRAGARASGAFDGPEDAAIAAYRQAKQLTKRRADAVELCSGLASLAMQPRREDISASCTTVLRRIKSWECITTLRTTIGEMLDGSVNALLLPVPEFQQRLHKVSMAVADLTDLVLQPLPAGPMYYTQSKKRQLQQEVKQQRLGQQLDTVLDHGGSMGGAGVQQRQADICVLQLLLSFRVLELLAALLDMSGVHGSRLDQQRQQDSSSDAKQQLEALSEEQAGLLCSLQVLVSSLASTSSGWSYLRAAGAGLEALAQAISLPTKVSLEGGELALDAAGPFNPAYGRPLLRQQLLAALGGSSGPPGTPFGVAAQLSAGLQRLLALSQAVGELQQQPARPGGNGSGSNTAAAVQVLVQVCFSSDSGREAVVCALGSCPPALQQLVSLLRLRGRVLAAAAGVEDEAANELASLEFDEDPISSSKAKGPRALSYGALYAPELLLAVLQDRHPDVVQHWLPLADTLLTAADEELGVQQRYGPGAMVAAFSGSAPALNPAAGAGPLLRGSGLVGEPGAAAAALERQQAVLQQIYGYADMAHQLVMHWRAGDGSGSGSGAFLLSQLQQLLPPLVNVGRTAAGCDGGLAPTSSDAAAAAAGSMGALAAVAAGGAATRGASSVAGVPPPWGKDVDAKFAVGVVLSSQSFAATLASLNLLSLLLKGPPNSIRHMVAAAAERPAELAMLKPALNPAVMLNPNGTLGPGGAADAATAGRLDGLGAQVLMKELLEGGVLEVLERGVRVGTCALEASNNDLLWGLRGGDATDDLERLRGRADAASLLLAASSVAASLMLLLAAAEVSDLSSCGLLDAIACAHAAVVTSHEGLAATIPSQATAAHLAAASNPAGSPAERAQAAAAAAAAVLRSGAGRCHLLLLQARQQLAVCLACWHKCGWWPDGVGAVLGEYPSASPALNQIAAEEAEARVKGERGALPPPAPKQGPRQLLAALLALGDMCPPEWPPPGASQAAAAAADAAAAAGRQPPAVAFERPSHMLLRAKIASSLEAHMARLAGLVSFAASADSSLVRAALVRLAVKAGSLGGGMSPFLVPLLLEVLRELLDTAIKAQAQLKATIQQKAAEGKGAAAQQRALQAASNAQGAPQLSGSHRVIEVLIPLAAKPGFKAVMLEGKAVGMMAKYLHKLAIRSKDEPGCHVVVGLLLQLLAALGNVDVSLTPLNPREVREAEDTPLLREARDVVAALLASAALLTPANMAAAADLLAGPCPAAGGRGFAQYAKGQAALRQGALRWYVSQWPEAAAMNAAGQQATPQLQAAAIDWVVARLADVAAAPAADPGHAAACRRVMEALRSAGAAVAADVADAPVTSAIMRFAKAVQESVAAAPASPTAEDLTTLLDTPPVFVACELTAANFWAVSKATEEALTALQQRQKRHRSYNERLPSEPCSVADLLGAERMVPPKRPRVQSGPVEWLLARAVNMQQQQQQQQPQQRQQQQAKMAEGTPGRAAESGEEGPVIPTIMAPRRSAALFKSGTSSRKASMHVDDYEGRNTRPPAAPPGPAAAAGGGGGDGQPGMLGAAFPGGPGGGPQAQPGMAFPGGPGRGMPVRPGLPKGGPGGPQAQPGRGMPGMPAAAGRGMGGGPMRGPMAGPMGTAGPPGMTMGGNRGAMQTRPQLGGRGWLPPPPPTVNQQQQQRVPPSDPRQQQQQQLQRQTQPQQQQRQQQKRPGPSGAQVQVAQPSSPGGGGSDLLGGLDGNSPSYHSSPGSSVDYGGAITEQTAPQEFQYEQQNGGDDGEGAYMVSEV